jgi:Fe2+ or Zn2+ uptake regulation protein
MSYTVSGYVFGLRLPASEKWLLVCLAEYADDWGDSIFPSLDELEVKSGMSRATIKRTLAKLLEQGLLERVAYSTPFSPAFYRILGVPPPEESRPRPVSCPMALRRAVLYIFAHRCEYCQREGSTEFDPDDKPWNVDRVVPGARGGGYTADNVTLACRACNAKKKDKSAQGPVRTLADRQRERVQIDPSPDVYQPDQSDPSRGVTLSRPGGHSDPSGGFTVNPDPITDPVIDPVIGSKAGAAPLPPDRPADNVSVITKLAHQSIDVLGVGDRSDLRGDLKDRCAALHIAYDSEVIDKAIESAVWQRQHGAGA